jgi:hypothetical protein
MILSSTIASGSAKENKMRNDFQLSTWWSNTLSLFGYTKQNRAGEQSVWYYEVSAPSGAGLTVLSSTSIRVDFTDNSGGIATHSIERSPTNENNYAIIHTNAAGIVTFTDTGLDPSTTYYYRARACHVNNYSAYCASVNATTQAGTDVDAQALIDRMTAAGETPADARKTIINAAFVLGKTKTFWTKLDAIWTMAAHGTASAKMNWLSTSYTLSLQGTPNPTFTTDQGYAGDGTNGYIKTGYVPSAGGKKWVQNSCSMGLYSRTSAAEAKVQMGVTTNSSIGFTNLTIRYTGDVFYSRADCSGLGSVANADGSGFFAVSRVGSTAFMCFHDKVKTDVTAASNGVPPEVYICCYDSDNSGTGTATLLSNKQLAFAFVGQGLTEAEIDDIYDCFVAGYLNSIGAKI